MRPGTGVSPSGRPPAPPRGEVPGAADIAAAKRSLARLANDIGALRARVELGDDRVAKLRARLDAMSETGRSETGAGQIEALSKRLEDSERARGEDREAVALVAQRVAEIERALGGFGARMSVLTERQVELEAAIQIVRGTLDTVAAPRPGDAKGTGLGAEDATVTVAMSDSGPDDLRRIKGVGPKYERALHAADVHTYRQIAAWSEDDLENIARRIGTRPERILRAGWIESARALMEGESLV